MNYKLIATDMDGTLLTDENLVGDRTIDSIRKAEEIGKITVLATGRMMKSAINYATRVGLKNPIISCNGAIITDKNQNIIYGGNIDHDLVRKIDKIARENEMYYHFYGEEKLYTAQYIDQIDEFYNKDATEEELIEIVEFKKVDDVLSRGIKVYKFLFLDSDLDKLAKVKEELEETKGLNISKSGTHNLEITREDVSKGNSLEILTRILGINIDEVIAIGDNENDISMLKKAGLSVAMKNATLKAKSVADIESEYDNNNDGVGIVIEKYLLNK